MTNFRSKGQLADYIYIFWGRSRWNGLYIDPSTASKIANHVFPQLKRWPMHRPEGVENALYGQDWLNRCIEHVMSEMDQERGERVPL